MFGEGDWYNAFSQDVTPTETKAPLKDPEPDAELRARLAYVAADGPKLTHRIHTVIGEELDHLAAEFGLKRRNT